jgi:uncharacterized membrane protein YcaP (DUF421 family)
VLLHRVLASAALRSPWLGRLLKGAPKRLVVDGQLQDDALRSEAITRHDLEEAARLHGLKDLGEVGDAVLERNGSISLRPRAGR